MRRARPARLPGPSPSLGNVTPTTHTHRPPTSWIATVLFLPGILPLLMAGPYSAALNDPTNPFDAPVPGFIGPNGAGKARIYSGVDGGGNPVYQNPSNYVNPLFFGWAASVTDYYCSDPANTTPSFTDSFLALGQVTGDNFDVVSLGDLNASRVAAGDPPGTITVELDRPIRNLSGADLVIFENGHLAQSNLGGAGIGGVFAELAYVEVSADGSNFVRFPATSLTAAGLSIYGSIDPTGIHQLAGKHVNGYGDSWGTPFDLDAVGLARITHVRLVDIPGDGTSLDRHGNPIYDPWYPYFSGTQAGTYGSGGFDLEAVAGISVDMTFYEWPQLESLDPGQRGTGDDPDGDGVHNLLEYAFARLPGLADTPDSLPSCQVVTNGAVSDLEFRFRRDERLTDLTYEVQVSETMAGGAWTTIASSSAGAPLTAIPGNTPQITETAASQITGVGVVREVKVREPLSTGAKRFFRVKISQSTP